MKKYKIVFTVQIPDRISEEKAIEIIKNAMSKCDKHIIKAQKELNSHES